LATLNPIDSFHPSGNAAFITHTRTHTFTGWREKKHKTKQNSEASEFEFSTIYTLTTTSDGRELCVAKPGFEWTPPAFNWLPKTRRNRALEAKQRFASQTLRETG